MASAIWKYKLRPRSVLEIPQGAKVLCVKVQNDEPHIWCLVDPNGWKVKRVFRVIPTGLEFDAAGLAYIGTFMVEDGALVFHVFEESA